MFGMIGLLAPAMAADFAAEPQGVHFSQEDNIFSLIAADTGYWPGPNDPLAVRFHITPTGGVTTDLAGDSIVRWSPMEHSVVDGRGEFGFDVDVDVAAEVSIDILGLYQDVVPLWEQEMTLQGGTSFDGLLLPGSAAESVEVQLANTELIEPMHWGYEIVYGLELAVDVQFFPELTATLAGSHIEAELDGEFTQQNFEGDWSPFVMTGDPGMVEGFHRWIGTQTSMLAFVIEPEVNLYVDWNLFGIGWSEEFTLVSFPIDVPILDNEDLIVLESEPTTHGLPALGATPPGIDFGEVLMGQLDLYELQLQNFGLMDLQGIATIEGPDAGSFSVWPEEFYALSENDDGLTVHFSPLSTLPQSAKLVLTSNSPGAPRVEIPLAGMGWEEAADVQAPPSVVDEVPDQTGDQKIVADRGCGCSSLRVGTGLWALMFAPLVLVRRRRA